MFCLPATFCAYRSLFLPSTWSALSYIRNREVGVDGGDLQYYLIALSAYCIEGKMWGVGALASGLIPGSNRDIPGLLGQQPPAQKF